MAPAEAGVFRKTDAAPCQETVFNRSDGQIRRDRILLQGVFGEKPFT